MGHPGSSSSRSGPLVGDASLWIALAATGCAGELLSAFERRFIITDIAFTELERGRQKGRTTADVIDCLVKSGCIEVVSLPPKALETYSGLVIGDGPSTLDDGEAATLVLACVLGGEAVIDERKARRIAQERFPDLQVRCTAELLLSQRVADVLGHVRCVDALFTALVDTRLRVPESFLAIVTEALGSERASQCPSLPARNRVV